MFKIGEIVIDKYDIMIVVTREEFEEYYSSLPSLENDEIPIRVLANIGVGEGTVGQMYRLRDYQQQQCIKINCRLFEILFT